MGRWCTSELFFTENTDERSKTGPEQWSCKTQKKKNCPEWPRVLATLKEKTKWKNKVAAGCRKWSSPLCYWHSLSAEEGTVVDSVLCWISVSFNPLLLSCSLNPEREGHNISALPPHPALHSSLYRNQCSRSAANGCTDKMCDKGKHKDYYHVMESVTDGCTLYMCVCQLQ